MIESKVRELFTEIARGEPHSSRVNVQLARRRGRARLRWRRACMSGTAVLAVAAITVGASTAWRDSGRSDSGLPPASAPLQFNPLVPYLSFGWLPAGNSLRDGDTSPDAVYLDAGRKMDRDNIWVLQVYAAGQCQLTGPVKELKCSTRALGGLIARITGPAPAVHGRHAYWATQYQPSQLPAGRAGQFLIWPYAHGGWASLGRGGPAAVKRDVVVKIADNVRYGAPTPPLMFPMQLKGVPSKWRVGSVFYQPDGRVMRASRFAVTTGTPTSADGGLQFQPNLPAFTDIEPAASHGNYCGVPLTKTINGYRVALFHGTSTSPYQALCTDHADGLEFQFGEQGAHPPISMANLFRDHLRLLGNNPANWTRKPIG
jgi:hypothetical protein